MCRLVCSAASARLAPSRLASDAATLASILIGRVRRASWGIGLSNAFVGFSIGEVCGESGYERKSSSSMSIGKRRDGGVGSRGSHESGVEACVPLIEEICVVEVEYMLVMEGS